jgi:hypothetical protein
MKIVVRFEDIAALGVYDGFKLKVQIYAGKQNNVYVLVEKGVLSKDSIGFISFDLKTFSPIVEDKVERHRKVLDKWKLRYDLQ